MVEAGPWLMEKLTARKGVVRMRPAYPVGALSHLAWLVIGSFFTSKCDNQIGME